MPDIYMNHGALTNATDDLMSSHNQMNSALTDFIAQVRPHLDNTEGATREAWEQFQTQVNNSTSRAHTAMHKAVTTLGQIHQEHVDADNRGAQIMGA